MPPPPIAIGDTAFPYYAPTTTMPTTSSTITVEVPSSSSGPRIPPFIVKVPKKRKPSMVKGKFYKILRKETHEMELVIEVLEEIEEEEDSRP